MAYTLTQLSTYYDAIQKRLSQIPTSDQIDDLTDLITNQHTAYTALVNALTARVQALEDRLLAHIAETDAHAS